ncbi:carbamoyl transferase [bacterium]|nr:carbamoyl transferase [bacterium]
MYILSIFPNFLSSVSLSKDGVVLSATLEERYTRLKNDGCFPKESIKYCLSNAGISADQSDYIAIAGKYTNPTYSVTNKSIWTVDDYIKEQKQYWIPRFYENKNFDDTFMHYVNMFNSYINYDDYPNNLYRKMVEGDKKLIETFYKDVGVFYADYLNLPYEKVIYVDHHKCHAYYSYITSNMIGEKVLALTADGMGDGLNATIGIFNEFGEYERLYETDQCFIARFYRYVTLILGMKPNEHEFKVMGMAPYGRRKYSLKAIDVFNNTLDVEGTKFIWKNKPTDSYKWFKDRLEGVRFDNIAFALQAWTESILTKWVFNCVEKYNINNVVFSGGVSMNIKANGHIAELENINNFHVGGSASDESMGISAGLCLYNDLQIKNNIKAKPKKLDTLYLGHEIGIEETIDSIKSLDLNDYKIITDPSNIILAEYLSKGLVLARCIGRMEFGQRALGNRSIIANPQDLRIKEKINKSIKNRDFWMPFAPVILDTFAEKYLINPKGLDSSYMTIGMNTTKEGFLAMSAACHPADKSARPQILNRNANPELYDLINTFALKTNIGALLNTSFNLHGFPIVRSASDAIYVLQNSELDGLILPGHLILRKNIDYE